MVADATWPSSSAAVGRLTRWYPTASRAAARSPRSRSRATERAAPIRSRSESSDERASASSRIPAMPSPAAMRETRAAATPASPAIANVARAPATRSRDGEPWQSQRCPAPRSRPIPATGWYRFGGSPNTRSTASASRSTTSFAMTGFRANCTRPRRSATETHAQPGANGEVGAGGAACDLEGHVDNDPRQDQVLDTGVEAHDVARVTLGRRGVEELAVGREPVRDLSAERGGHGLLEQEVRALRLADPREPHVHVEAQRPRQIEAREGRAADIDPLRADRRARRRQLHERQDSE